MFTDLRADVDALRLLVLALLAPEVTLFDLEAVCALALRFDPEVELDFVPRTFRWGVVRLAVLVDDLFATLLELVRDACEFAEPRRVLEVRFTSLVARVAVRFDDAVLRREELVLVLRGDAL